MSRSSPIFFRFRGDLLGSGEKGSLYQQGVCVSKTFFGCADIYVSNCLKTYLVFHFTQTFLCTYVPSIVSGFNFQNWVFSTSLVQNKDVKLSRYYSILFLFWEIIIFQQENGALF